MNRYGNKSERAARMVDFRREMAPSAATGEGRRVDRGPVATALNLEAKSIENDNHLAVLWTGANMQLTVMSIPVGAQIPWGVHQSEEQMIYIERGECEVSVGAGEMSPELITKLKSGYSALIPSGKHYRVKNIGDRELKLFSIFAPPVHMRGTVHP